MPPEPPSHWCHCAHLACLPTHNFLATAMAVCVFCVLWGDPEVALPAYENFRTESFAIPHAGAHQLDKNTSIEEHIPVKRIIRHPQYNRRKFFKNDATLLQLERPVRLSDKKNMVCLPQNTTNPPYGTDCFVSGARFSQTDSIFDKAKYCEILQFCHHFVDPVMRHRRRCMGVVGQIRSNILSSAGDLTHSGVRSTEQHDVETGVPNGASRSRDAPRQIFYFYTCYFPYHSTHYSSGWELTIHFPWYCWRKFMFVCAAAYPSLLDTPRKYAFLACGHLNFESEVTAKNGEGLFW